MEIKISHEECKIYTSHSIIKWNCLCSHNDCQAVWAGSRHYIKTTSYILHISSEFLQPLASIDRFTDNCLLSPTCKLIEAMQSYNHITKLVFLDLGCKLYVYKNMHGSTVILYSFIVYILCWRVSMNFIKIQPCEFNGFHINLPLVKIEPGSIRLKIQHFTMWAE